MPGGFAPRFAIEAGFLILLGVGAGIADLRPVVIVLLLAGAWLLVSLIELAAWRSNDRYVGVYIQPPAFAADAGDEAEPDEPDDFDADSFAGEEEGDYPLRADSAEAPSEEVEAYTRILGARVENDPPGEAAE